MKNIQTVTCPACGDLSPRPETAWTQMELEALLTGICERCYEEKWHEPENCARECCADAEVLDARDRLGSDYVETY